MRAQTVKVLILKFYNWTLEHLDLWFFDGASIFIG